MPGDTDVGKGQQMDEGRRAQEEAGDPEGIAEVPVWKIEHVDDYQIIYNYLCIYLSIYLNIYLSIYLYVQLSTSIHTWAIDHEAGQRGPKERWESSDAGQHTKGRGQQLQTEQVNLKP